MNQRWLDKLIYGECPNCRNTGKDSSYLYRKLDEKDYWVTYHVCKSCGAPFGHKIEGDVGADFWLHEQNEKLLTLTSFLVEQEQNLQLVKGMLKKIKRCEYVPSDQRRMVIEWLDKQKGSRVEKDAITD